MCEKQKEILREKMNDRSAVSEELVRRKCLEFYLIILFI